MITYKEQVDKIGDDLYQLRTFAGSRGFTPDFYEMDKASCIEWIKENAVPGIIYVFPDGERYQRNQ